jgi:hypothetical protein
VTNKYILLALLAVLSPSLAPAQEAIKLNMSDVYFQFRPMPKGSAMCGYSILGNHTSRDDPKIEWDINVDEIVQGDNRLVGVSVGTFDVKGKTRTPRRPESTCLKQRQTPRAWPLRRYQDPRAGAPA